MKLVVDFGNSFVKVGVFDTDNLLEDKIYNVFDINELSSLFNTFPEINQSIISSVVFHDDSIDDFLKKNTNYLKLTHHTKVPITINYKTKDTLGLDRLCAAVAGNHQYPGNNVLIIVAGTCITYNFVNSKKEFLGGAISPGYDMRIKAMNHFTHKLPLVKKSDSSELIGDTTEKSLQSGAYNGMLAEIDEIISRYTSAFKNLKVILSGGDAKYFDKKLKNNIFAVPNIVLRGLNKILDFNAN